MTDVRDVVVDVMPAMSELLNVVKLPVVDDTDVGSVAVGDEKLALIDT